MLTRFVTNLIDSTTVPEVRQTFFDAMASYGFEHTFYAARFLLSLPTSVFHEEVEIFNNFPTDFVDTLVAHEIPSGSRWASWALRNSGNISLATLAETYGGDGLSETASERGLAGGRLLSLKDKVLRSHGAVILNPRLGISVIEADEVWEQNADDVRALCWIMHMRMATILRRRSAAILTKRQREVLEWSSAGKTVAEIGTIIGVTAATVEKHLRLARESLGAGNTALAILKAHLTNQIFTPDGSENPFR